MKKRFLVFISTIALLQACGDEHQFQTGLIPAPNNAKVKFVHAASDTVGVNLFIDDLKVTANPPIAITTFGAPNLGKVTVGSVSYQNAYPVTNYAGVDRTSGTLSVIFPETHTATTSFGSKTLSTVAGISLSPEKYYTVAFLGTSPTYETVVYEDDLSQAPIDGSPYIRFANFIPNSTELSLRLTPPAVEDDPNPVPITLFTNVQYKGMTAFAALPRTGTHANVQILNTTTGAVITTLAAPNNAFANNKVYTVFARGRIGVAGAAAPGASRAINR